jgi:rRNA maturation RNase YbeY
VPVYFHSERINFELESQAIYKKWILAVLSQHKKRPGNLNIIFVSNDYLLEMNKKFLNHNYHTDVISFDDSEKNVVAGDIFISVDQVKINSRVHNVGFNDELCRVMIHGVLHLIGFGDADDTQKEMMRTQEDQALVLLDVIRNGKDI